MRFAKNLRFTRTVAALFLAVGLVVASGPSVDAQKKWRSGTISFNTKSIGFLFGYEWGYGTVKLNNGKAYRIRVRMLKAGVIGVESISAYGTVYNVRNVRDIEGTYAAGGAGATLGGGAGIATLQNAKGVIIEVRETSAGLAAKIAASGVQIRLR